MKFKQLRHHVMNNDNTFFTLLRATLTSQTSSWTDMAVSFCMFAWVIQIPWLATAIGAICGGIVNCIMGYKFTFHVKGANKKVIFIKFLLVWFGSLMLNSLGTQGLNELLTNWTWLEDIGFKPDGYFAAARLTVSLIVSIFWNFLLQRYFVFRPTRFDPYALRIFNAFKF